MAGMRVCRWVGVLYLTVMMGWSPVAPPEHVHESDDEHGTHHVLVHRHAEGHLEGVHAAEHAELGEGESLTLTLDVAFMVPPSPVHSIPVSTVAIVLDEPPVPLAQRVVAADVELLIHGPPRAPTGLRAPPSASRL
jgi:hypothetical protein